MTPFNVEHKIFDKIYFIDFSFFFNFPFFHFPQNKTEISLKIKNCILKFSRWKNAIFYRYFNTAALVKKIVLVKVIRTKPKHVPVTILNYLFRQSLVFQIF